MYHEDFDPKKELYSTDAHVNGSTGFKTLADFERHFSTNESDVSKFVDDVKNNCCPTPVCLSDPKFLPDIPADTEVEQSTTVDVTKNRPAPPAKNLTFRPRKPVKNVLSQMLNQESKGPVKLLTDCLTNRRKLKVHIRARCRLRSIISGFLVAFDKHWNLTLTDVDERFCKPKCLKVARKNRPQDEHSVEIYKHFRESFQFVSEKQLNHFEWVQRHVPQLFVKGDEIILICIDS